MNRQGQGQLQPAAAVANAAGSVVEVANGQAEQEPADGRTTFSMEVACVGMRYRNAGSSHDFSRSRAYTLEREPSNAHDANAVAVICEGTTIGFVSRSTNGALAAHMDAGAAVDASFLGMASRGAARFRVRGRGGAVARRNGCASRRAQAPRDGRTKVTLGVTSRQASQCPHWH